MMKRNARKVREGVVVANKMQKTITVRIERAVRHELLGKVVYRAKKYYAHAENAAEIPLGQKVRIVETRPLSKLKHWRILQVV